MKTLAKLSSSLMTQEEALALKLKEQHHIILLSNSLMQKHGIVAKELNFDLVKSKNGMLSLVGRVSDGSLQVTKSPDSEEIIR